MSENATCAVESSPGQVRRELSELKETIGIAADNVTELTERLSCVTRTEPTTGDDSPPGQPEEVIVGLAEEIRCLRGRVREIASRSSATIALLEL